MSLLINPYRHAAAGFNPLTQVTALHAMWADDPAWTNPGDGNAVSSWRNQSGGGDPAMTGSNRPTFRASVAGLNNHAALEFVGASSQRLDVDVADQAQPYKVLAVFYQASITNSTNVLGAFGNGGTNGFGTGGTGAFYLNAGTTLAVLTPGTTGAHVLRATLDGGSSAGRIDEGSPASGAANSGALVRLTIGCGFASPSTYSRHLTGHVAFYAAYAGATSDVNLASLAADLKTYYGIA